MVAETAEHERLKQDRERSVYWKRWGPYVSERQWGTVREDYSPDGTAWDYLPHDAARSRVYRWGEDGLAGICDRHQYMCFALALWNGQDAILKERLFGLTGQEGNHGEDVKEYYYYLDNTPTHSYMKYLYKYTQREYPYSHLVEENRQRGRTQPEFELIDTGVFDENRYFDVFMEYAKATSEDMLIRITVANRGPDEATLDLLPTLWLRNIWSWEPNIPRPTLSQYARETSSPSYAVINVEPGTRVNIPHEGTGTYVGKHWLYCEGTPTLLFTENETNTERLYGAANATPYVKDGLNDYFVHGKQESVNPAHVGTD